MALEIKTDVENVDWQQLAEVYVAAFNGIQTAELIEKVFRRSYATRIAILDGQIVGGVYAFSDGELDATIHGLAVHPNFQMRGVGRALMESLLEQFPPHIALLLTAEAAHQPIYHKFGFRPLETAMAKGFPEDDMEP